MFRWCCCSVSGAQHHGKARRVAPVLAAAVFCSYALWWVPHSPDRSDRLELHQNAEQMLLSAGYPLAGAVFLAATAVTVWRARRRGGQDVQKE